MTWREEFGQCDSLKEYLRDFAVPGLWFLQRKSKKSIARDMDMSPSELTRKLSNNPNDPRNFTIDDLERYLHTQADLSPIFYLLEKYSENPDDELARLKARVAELERTR